MLQVKSLVGAKLKALDDEGKGLALIATLNVVDKDGDVTLPGAFGNQTSQVVPTHDWGHVPLGKASIREEGDSVLAEFALNLEIQAAKDWHSAMKNDLANPPSLQEWSYGFTINESSYGDFEGREVRFLKAMTVHEISPVMIGAGVGTGTLAMKKEKPSSRLVDHIAGALKELTGVIERCNLIKAAREEEGRDMSADRYADLKVIQVALGELDQIKVAMAKLIKRQDSVFDVLEDEALANELLSQHTAAIQRLRGNKI